MIIRNIVILLLVIFIMTFNSCNSSYEEKNNLRIGNRKYINAKYNESESYYLKSIEADTTLEALYGWGNSVQRQNIYSGQEKQDTLDSIAGIIYQKCIELNPINKLKLSKVYHNFGNLYYRIGLKYKNLQNITESNNFFLKSVSNYKSSLRLNPSDDETRYNLAKALYLLNQQHNNSENQQQDNKDKNNDKDKNNKKENENNKTKQNQDKDDKTMNNNEQNENNKNQGNNKQESNSFQNLNNIDKKTAEKLLKAAQQDENKVHKKLEKANSVGNNTKEKDW